MKLFTLAALSAASLSLAACGGSSVDGDMSDTDLPTKYDSLEGLVASAEAGDLDPASGAMMTGTATMSGALGVGDLGDDGNLEALGDLALTADFTGGTVTGTADNFALYDQDTQAVEAELSGSLTINGSITGTGMTADADGTLNDGEDHLVDLVMDGTFYDYEGDLAVYGDVTGTIDGDYEEGGYGAIAD
ncbi:MULTISPECIES: hypothetical protein [Roseobacteraceae]|uniref:Transferrin-binding protein B C-lobe/N-lobe beta barrel domain-containing protein n=1 Tax=Celeribacter baekdonensis B30 TaxID=1208323 RepID=K2IP78_9RHOB|nr:MULTISPECIES: hypothetical protein [Roseobacteraceae]EKE71966.1 hypothetical protein B30_09358 [Celeribacter baekdonensis B30]KAB6715035.1 hypothetical protein C8029_17330 [Roseobacter sp. TSBP12]|tara:strand:- start:2039 stop:2608 length:570 start_codon:yes stop_codon:yes gene_type:complete